MHKSSHTNAAENKAASPCFYVTWCQVETYRHFRKGLHFEHDVCLESNAFLKVRFCSVFMETELECCPSCPLVLNVSLNIKTVITKLLRKPDEAEAEAGRFPAGMKIQTRRAGGRVFGEERLGISAWTDDEGQ